MIWFWWHKCQLFVIIDIVKHMRKISKFKSTNNRNKFYKLKYNGRYYHYRNRTIRKIIGKDVVLNNLGSTTCEEETEEIPQSPKDVEDIFFNDTSDSDDFELENSSDDELLDFSSDDENDSSECEFNLSESDGWYTSWKCADNDSTAFKDYLKRKSVSKTFPWSNWNTSNPLFKIMLTPIPNTFGNLTIGVLLLLVLGILYYLNIASSKLNLLLEFVCLLLPSELVVHFPKSEFKFWQHMDLFDSPSPRIQDFCSKCLQFYTSQGFFENDESINY